MKDGKGYFRLNGGDAPGKPSGNIRCASKEFKLQLYISCFNVIFIKVLGGEWSSGMILACTFLRNLNFLS